MPCVCGTAGDGSPLALLLLLLLLLLAKVVVVIGATTATAGVVVVVAIPFTTVLPCANRRILGSTIILIISHSFFLSFSLTHTLCVCVC